MMRSFLHASDAFLGAGSEIRGAEHADEDLGLADLSCFGIHNRHRLACVVHEHLLSGPVLLAKHRVQTVPPSTVALAELCVLVAGGWMRRLIFEPLEGRFSKSFVGLPLGRCLDFSDLDGRVTRTPSREPGRDSRRKHDGVEE